MLRPYPIESVAENWLHEIVCDMLRIIHDHTEAGTQPPAWPDIIPEQRREKLRRRTGLRNKIESYHAVLKTLTNEHRALLREQIEAQNDIPGLVTCARECTILDGLPEAARTPIQNLFDFCFDLLGPLELRDLHYRVIHSAGITICAFCGCEHFDAPGGPREDYDHYLVRTRYPFAAANLRNLVPMGKKCNSTYKKTEDVLRTEVGRRRAFDPYTAVGVRVDLSQSRPFEGAGMNPAWQVDFVPNAPEVDTWDAVFSIRQRYVRDHLDVAFRSWLDAFRKWCSTRGFDPTREPEDVLQEYVEDIRISGETETRGFLRTAAFEMLHQRLLNGDQRLSRFVRDFYTPA